MKTENLDESAVPVGEVFGPKAVSNMVALVKPLPPGTKLFTHPPEQAEQVEDDADGLPVGFADWYNRTFASQHVDCTRMDQCERAWRYALASQPSSTTAEPVAQGEVVAWRYVNKAGKPINQWALVPTDDDSFVEFVKHRAKLSGATVEFAAPPAQPRAVPDARIVGLAERLVASGPKAAHVSASECHEISEFILSLAAPPIDAPDSKR